MKRIRQTIDLLRSIAACEEAVPHLLNKVRQRCEGLCREERILLFQHLARDLEVDRAAIEEPLGDVLAIVDGDPISWGRALNSLRQSLRSPRRLALERFINVEGGIKFILELRVEVLEAQRAGHEGLDLLEEDIAGLLNSWFRHGFLFLEEVNLNSSFNKIRFLKDRELVHPMLSLEEMGRRLGEDRMCFALYHCVMPEEPVVFIEVALARGLIRSIHDIIEDRPAGSSSGGRPDTAIFYSINNTQNGLAGLGLGKVLVSRVQEALEDHHPSLRTFATLSPIPGLWDRYLRPILEGRGDRFRLGRDDVLDLFSPRAADRIAGREAELAGSHRQHLGAVLLSVLSRPDWIDDPSFARYLSRPLREIAYTYISEEKDRRGKPLNPVANFHLGNGASISKSNVHFAANRSRRGLEESCSVMANYVYSSTALRQISSRVRSLLPWGR